MMCVFGRPLGQIRWGIAVSDQGPRRRLPPNYRKVMIPLIAALLVGWGMLMLYIWTGPRGG